MVEVFLHRSGRVRSGERVSKVISYSWVSHVCALLTMVFQRKGVVGERVFDIVRVRVDWMAVVAKRLLGKPSLTSTRV